MLPRERLILLVVLLICLWFFIDLETPFGNYLWEQRTDSYERYSFQENNLRIGYINRRGRVVIQPQFTDGVKYFSKGLAPVCVGDRWGYINPKGEMVIGPRFSRAEEFSEGLALISEKGQFLDRYGYINEKGDVVIAPQYIDAKSFSEGLTAVKVGYRWGYIDTTGKIIIESQFDKAQGFSEGLAAVQLNGKWGYLNKLGIVVIPFQFDQAKPFAQGLAPVALGTVFPQWGYIGKAGSYVMPLQFDEADVFSEELAAVRSGVQKSFIDSSGEKVVKSNLYLEVRNFSEGLAAVRVKESLGSPGNGKWGFIDPQGALVIQPKFDWATDFKGGLARVGMEVGRIKRGYINKKGIFIWDPAGWEQKSYVRHSVAFLMLVIIFAISLMFYNTQGEYRKRLKIFTRQAQKRNGTLEFAGFFLDPKICFVRNGVPFQVSRIQKTQKYQWPEILVSADLPGVKDHFVSFHIKLDSRFVTTSSRSTAPSEFIRLIEVDETDDKEYMSQVLTPEMRNKLVEFKSAGYFFGINIVGGKFSARFDGVPTHDKEYDWIIDMAVMFYERMKELG